MKKKIIPCIHVVSLLFSIGCYSNQTITMEQLEAKPKEELKAEFEQRDITVFTKDSLEYKFLKDNYSIQSDTLIGFGVQRISGKDERFHGSIAFADIALLKTETLDLTTTIIVIAVPVVLAAGFFIYVATMLSHI